MAIAKRRAHPAAQRFGGLNFDPWIKIGPADISAAVQSHPA
jgi:hypothetical protein